MKSCYDYHKMLRVSSDINQTGLRSPDMSGQFVHLKFIFANNHLVLYKGTGSAKMCEQTGFSPLTGSAADW